MINRWQWTCWGRRPHFPVEGQWTGAGTKILPLCCPRWQVWSVCQSLEPVQQPSGSMSRQFQWQLGRRGEYPQDHNTWRTYWQPLYRVIIIVSKGEGQWSAIGYCPRHSRLGAQNSSAQPNYFVANEHKSECGSLMTASWCALGLPVWARYM